MNDLSMHILDIVSNSIRAEASVVTLAVEEKPREDVLVIRVKDNGKGMTAEQVARLHDPFFTSRTTRKVGMGVPLLIATAQQSGGDVKISSVPGEGTEVEATFGYSNIDRPPLGDFVNAFMLLASANAEVDFVLEYRYEDESCEFSTAEVKEIFDENVLQNLTIVRNIEEMIKDNVNLVRNC